jgi:ParB family chromosome partitioning protein
VQIVKHATQIEQVPIDGIVVTARHRKDLGDLDQLADDIEDVGLLQPIGVTENLELVFGERRIEAVKLLGWDSIAARIVDVPSIARGEWSENEVRKDFTVEERVAIADTIKLELGNRQGERTDLESGDSKSAGPTSELAARRAGFGSAGSYRRAKTVVNKGARNVIDAVNRGDVSINTAAKAVANATLSDQAAWTIDDIKEAAKEAREELPTPKQAKAQAELEGVGILARDGKYYWPSVSAEESRRTSLYIKIGGILRELQRAVADLDPAEVAAAPKDGTAFDSIDDLVDSPIDWLNRFREAWHERRRQGRQIDAAD